MDHQPSHVRSLITLAGFIVVTFCAPLAGMISPPGDWYATLNKPSWNPPGWIFGPVWTLLYLMMAVAAWWVWRKIGWQRPLWIYSVQLALNAAWTPIFFGAHELGWALVEIIALWIAIVVTALGFFHVSRPAGWMLVPYVTWVAFAAFLNFTLWRMNLE